MVVPKDDKLLLPTIVLLFVGEIVWGVGLLLHKVSAVFFVFQDAKEYCAGPFIAAHGADAFLLQFPRDHMGAFSFIDELVEDVPHDLSARPCQHFCAK